MVSSTERKQDRKVKTMRYLVSDRFYNSLVGLIGIAIEDNNPVEMDLIMDIIQDTATGQDNHERPA
jgi:hypothetical protein